MPSLGHRGRLIHPLLIRVARLSTAAIRAAGMYSDETRVPAVDYSTGVRRTAREVVGEPETVELHAQVEDGLSAFEQRLHGADPQLRSTLVIHFEELEQLDLVDPKTGEALCPRENDRLAGIYQRDGSPALVPSGPGGVYCTGGAVHGGLGGGRNLYLSQWMRRPLSTSS